MPAWYDAIHSDGYVRFLVLIGGLFIGLALAASDWRTKFGIGTLITAAVGLITTPLMNNFDKVRQFVEEAEIIRPIVMALNIALVVALVLLLLGSLVVFVHGYFPARRRGDPEAFAHASRAAMSALMGGLWRYATVPPNAEAANQIADLEKHVNILRTIQRTIAGETTSAASVRSVQHFKDIVDAAGRALLMASFGESPHLQKFRMAVFEARADKLEYLVAINNGDWTAHSGKPFVTADCLMGEAIAANRPLVYPRDKKWRSKYTKRANERYKSFVAIPIPCGPGTGSNVGVLTVDYTETDAAFTPRRIAELGALAQLIHCLYVLNGVKAP